jgi:hypothetical protein
VRRAPFRRSNHADESAAGASDTIEIAASSAARTEIGVVRWSVAKSADGAVTGYDADDNRKCSIDPEYESCKKNLGGSGGGANEPNH